LRSIDQRPRVGEQLLVGREHEAHQLAEWWDEARGGKRLSVHVTGGPGIGKTALVKTWLEKTLGDGDELLFGQTCCVKTSANPPCLPFLQLLDRLCKGAHGELVTDMLSRRAPGWLTQLPWLSEAVPNASGNPLSQDVRQESLFLQTAEFLEALSHEIPVLLLIEDLHWCDQLTRDLLSHLFLRQEPARLMVVSTHCTWRTQPDNLALGESDTSHGAQREIALGPLSEECIEDYVLKRTAAEPCPPILAADLGRQSGGHPLYLKSALDELTQIGNTGLSSASNMHTNPSHSIVLEAPHSFRKRLDIEAQTLSSDEWPLLQAGSVVVVPAFSAAAIAAILDQDIVETEEQCDELARRGLWIRRLGSRRWPDGTLAQLFDFPHPIYRDYIYQTIPAARCCRFHLRHARRLETAYCEDTTIIASNLAYHFKRGGEPQRAEHYQQCTGRPNRAAPLPKLGDLTPRRHAQSDRCELSALTLQRISAPKHANALFAGCANRPA
jgi:predicted ATPase